MRADGILMRADAILMRANAVLMRAGGALMRADAILMRSDAVLTRVDAVLTHANAIRPPAAQGFVPPAACPSPFRPPNILGTGEIFPCPCGGCTRILTARSRIAI